MSTQAPSPHILRHEYLAEIKQTIEYAVKADGVAVLPPMDAEVSLRLMKLAGLSANATIIDPWYNKGIGGVRSDYKNYIIELLKSASCFSQHLFLWGFPEIIACFVEAIPPPLNLVAWLTWYYKNNPSVIRGWRSSQNACLHLAHPGAKLYPEHFLNEAQKQLQFEKKLRYMPGPTSVIEEALLVGFVGRKQQTGHPAQKPIAVFQRIILMSTRENDLVFDPMSGSGTTGEAARETGRFAVIADISEEYTQLAEKRLGVRRVAITQAQGLRSLLHTAEKPQ